MNLDEKNMVLENIDFLLKTNGMKKADLERKTGYSIGYLSRFRNDDPNSLPSVGFLLAASKLLNVEFAALMESNLTHESVSEKFIRNLLLKLIKDTTDSQICWTIDSVEEASKSTMEKYFYSKDIYVTVEEVLDFDNQSGPICMPEQTELLIKKGFKPLSSPKTKKQNFNYSQTFVDGFLYITSLNENVSIVLLSAFEYPNNMSSIDDDPNKHLQLWILGDGDDLLCDEKTCSPYFADLLKRLDSIISSSSIVMNSSNKNALDGYLKGELNG